jgi:hypothetical protein
MSKKLLIKDKDVQLSFVGSKNIFDGLMVGFVVKGTLKRLFL